MNNIYKISFFILLLSIFSCKKESLIRDDLYAQVVSSLSNYQYVPSNNYDSVLFNMGAYIDSRSYPGLPAIVDKANAEDTYITGKISYDPALFEIFDSIYHTNALPLTDEKLFKVINDGKLLLKQGQTITSDSLKIKLNDFTTFPATNKTYKYLVPIVFSTTSSNIKLKSNIIYYIFSFRIVNNIIISIENTFFDLDDKNLAYNFDFKISTRVSKDIAIELEDLSSKQSIEEYNSKSGGNYIALPKDSYSLKTSVSFPANETNNNIKSVFVINDYSKIDESKSYILPLKIKNLNNSPTYYIRIWRNDIINDNEKINGNPINKKDWSIQVSSEYNQNSLKERAIDNNNTTTWSSKTTPKPHWLILDLGKIHSIKGFEIVPNYTYRTENILEMDIYSSNDNINWTYQGIYIGSLTSSSSSSSSPDFKYFSFRNKVNNRYFKFVINKHTANYTGLNEISAYE
ncbi:discoidin domain-containing protein [Sphingobacterium bovistauri]|uniref:DUF1735 domain-containing protein n=1 Tax=Sphingobacterium bovistauri TaxID=2781959 RepID=A0ABS7Z6B4_9SPHI|nr:discoidin domain-containing protein [Sphingobacterium bovistauri]MCA5005097.1 DUF1735 domain-containing protein [Sphingobacterium bovistauri]